MTTTEVFLKSTLLFFTIR